MADRPSGDGRLWPHCSSGCGGRRDKQRVSGQASRILVVSRDASDLAEASWDAELTWSIHAGFGRASGVVAGARHVVARTIGSNRGGDVV